MKKRLIIIIGTLLLIQPVLAKEQFGSVQVDKGMLTIIRNAEAILKPAQQQVPVHKFDLLMAGEDTTITWRNNSDSSIQFGSNSMILLKPWKRSGDTGYVAIGYGGVALQTAAESVIKTPSAIIRYKGRALIQVTRSGNTMVVVQSGTADINDLSGSMKSISEGQLAFLINGLLIIPDKEQTDGLPVSNQILAMPPIHNQAAFAFSIETALLGAGILSPDMVEQSRNTKAGITNSFDVHIDSTNEANLADPVNKQVNSEMAADLEAMNDLTLIEVESETDELGTIQIRESRPENVFADFAEPKTPGTLFDLDDKTSWSLESGLILVTIEK